MCPTGLALEFACLRLPRRDCGAEECQDAAAADAARGCFAVADGASESAHAGLWARLLVEGFVAAGGDDDDGAGWLPAAQERWSAAAPRAAGAAELPWYLEAGVRQGAFATFLGLAVDEAGWRALAVGDSCLFHVRGDELVQAFPVASSADFGNAPWLIGTRTVAADLARSHARRQRGDWRPGDRLWLMTDALAQWFLSDAEAGRRPWWAVSHILGGGASAFAGWVEDMRGLRRLRNDDVTLLSVDLTQSGMGNGEWGMGNAQTGHSPFPIPHSRLG
jgi:hypothetical protein